MLTNTIAADQVTAGEKATKRFLEEKLGIDLG
jgi:hypothetical protein